MDRTQAMSRVLNDFYNALVWADDKLSALIIAPPSQGKSFYLKQLTENVKTMRRITQITSAGLRKFLDSNQNVSHIVISDIGSVSQQKRDYSVFNIMLEAAEEGISDIYLSKEIVVVRRKVGFILAMTPKDFRMLLKRLPKKQIDTDAFLSRFIMFNYEMTRKNMRKILRGGGYPFHLKVPERLVFHHPAFVDRVYDVAYKLLPEEERQSMLRIIRNHVNIAKGFAAFKGYDIMDDRVLAFVVTLLVMRSKRLKLNDIAKFWADPSEGLKVDVDSIIKITDGNVKEEAYIKI